MTTAVQERAPTEFELLTQERDLAQERMDAVANQIRAIESAVGRGVATSEQVAALPGLREQARVAERDFGHALRRWKEVRKAGEQDTRRVNLEAALDEYNQALPGFEATLDALIGAATAYANRAPLGPYGIDIRALERARDAIADRDGSREAHRVQQAAAYLGRPTHYVSPPLPTA